MENSVPRRGELVSFSSCFNHFFFNYQQIYHRFIYVDSSLGLSNFLDLWV